MSKRKNTLSLAVAVMMAGGTLCYGQARPGENLGERQTPAQPQGQGKAVAPGGDRADQGQPAAAAQTPGAAHAAMSSDPKQIDQQVEQQFQKIEQQKDGMAGDRAFVLEAGLGGHFEIAAARQALQKSQDPSVKQIAQTIIQDHEQANAKLMPVAQKLQVDVPMGLTSMKQHKLNILASLESKEFDQAYLACMDEAHAHDVHAFRNKSQLAKSADVKQFAAQTLPKLQEHHQLIKQSATAMGLPAAMDAQPAAGRLPGAGAQPGNTVPNSTPGQHGPSGESAPGGRANPGADK